MGLLEGDRKQELESGGCPQECSLPYTYPGVNIRVWPRQFGDPNTEESFALLVGG